MMEQTAQDVYGGYVAIIILFGLIAIICNGYALSRRFFLLPYTTESAAPLLPFRSVATVFLIYLGATMLLAPVLARLITTLYALRSPPASPPLTAMGWIQLTAFALTLLLFFLYCRTQNPALIKRIWKNWSIPNAEAPSRDFFAGVLTWILGFPVVVVVGQIADLFLYRFFGVINYEQVAVRYLKMALSSPPLLLVALFTILIAAPVIEEFLFRGFLQTYFKQHLGKRPAIFLASICFALFHLSPSQGWGNISLVVSLFSFSCYLGFIYEKRGSLFASIGLHMTFNAISTSRILFFPES